MIKLHTYQREALDFLLFRLLTLGEKGGSLQLDPGLGKTLVSLCLIRELRRYGMAQRVLIVAPLRVCVLVWRQEIAKWGFNYTTSLVHGSAKRTKLLAPSDIYIVNRESVPWLAEQYQAKFDLLINDESTSFKNWSAKRTTAMRKLLKRIPRRVNLTGTPIPNGEQDWFAQQYIADDGEALGKTITYFRQWAMRVDPNQHFGVKYYMSDSAKDEFYRRIAPSVLRMAAEDHLDMPPRVDRIVEVELPTAIERIYRQIEKHLFAQLDTGQDLVASSAGAKYTLCRQIANGGAYQTDQVTGERAELYVHDAKLEAVREIVSELNGKPAIVAYQFDHDRDRLSKAFPKAPAIRGGLSIKRTIEIVDAWNAGQVPVLLVQPQALSHGANMQTGGRDLIWFGHTDQLEIFQQLNARIYRQGQTGQVRFHHIIARGTIDEAVYQRLEDKADDQDAMMRALQTYRREHGI